jgi:Holliday junction resolvasome RuvABC ATP-dependent DNA helicase subunit
MITPQSFDEYVGQPTAKQLLQTVLKNIRFTMKGLMGNGSEEEMKKAGLYMPPSFLIIGPPGYGKTRLSNLYAQALVKMAQDDKWPVMKRPNVNYNQMVVNWAGPGDPSAPYYFASLEGKNIPDEKVLDSYLYFLQVQGVLFIDEFHTIPRKLQNHFLLLMQDHRFYSLIENRLMDHYGFTLIGATTDEAKISRPFRERFKLSVIMEPYTMEEQKEIIRQYANKVKLNLGTGVLELLADRTRDCPRTIVQNMEMLEMVKNGQSNNIVTKTDALEALKMRSIGPYGLMPKDVKILQILDEYKAVGVETLIEMLDFVNVQNYRVYERYLVERGYVMPTKPGRVITNLGKKILKDMEK